MRPAGIEVAQRRYAHERADKHPEELKPQADSSQTTTRQKEDAMDLMRRSAGNTSNGEFTIAFPNGPIKFQSDEGVLYSRLFHIVRTLCSLAL